WIGKVGGFHKARGVPGGLASGQPFSCINVERELHRSIVNPGHGHDFRLQRKTHSKWHCPSPVPSPRAAKAILVHKARGEGQGEGTCSVLCKVRVKLCAPSSRHASANWPMTSRVSGGLCRHGGVFRLPDDVRNRVWRGRPQR